jgi:hypothetical protein
MGSFFLFLINPSLNIFNRKVKNRSKAYECARTSETTVDIFNQQICYYVPLRNEKHKTIFVMEIKSKEYNESSQKYDSELDQIETILYVLHKCQEELLNEHFASITENKYSFETQYEHEKFEIIFEKCYLNHLHQSLKSLIGQQVNEMMPDGSPSPETSQMSQLIRLVNDLTGHDSFYQNQVCYFFPHLTCKYSTIIFSTS